MMPSASPPATYSRHSVNEVYNMLPPEPHMHDDKQERKPALSATQSG